MRKKINYKNSSSTKKKKKRHPIKLINQGNLNYLDKLANHVNLIEKQNKNK
jgi:hypothetical protein